MKQFVVSHRASAGWLLAVVAIGVLVPDAFGAGWLSTFTTCAVVALPAAGVGLLYGELGLTSLTQFAFVGIGGWVALRLGIGFGWPMPALIAAAAVVTALFGAALSIPALRLRDLYLALVTLLVAASVNKGGESREHRRSRQADKLLTGKYTGLPVFLAVMFLVFWLTFEVIGNRLSDGLSLGIDQLTGLVFSKPKYV